MLGEGDGVVVELEGVGVGQCDGEHLQELLRAEAGEHLRHLLKVEQHVRQICSLHYSTPTQQIICLPAALCIIMYH